MIRTKKQQVCRSGDFIVAEMDAKVGGYGFIPEELNGAIVSSHYFLFELDEDKIRPKYLDVICQLRILQDQIEAIGSTNYAAIRPVNVLNWNIPIPTIEEQIRIENLFSSSKSISSKLANELTHQLSLVKSLRQQLLQDAVQGKLVAQNPEDEPASVLLKKIKAEKEKRIAEKKIKKEKPLPPIKPEEIPFEIPEGWVWCRLGEIAEIGTGATPLTSNPEYYKGGSIPWITSSSTNNLFVDVTEFYITEKALIETNCKIYPIGTLVVAMYGQGKTRGQITELNFPAATNQACAAIVFFLDDLFVRKYVKLFFQKIYNEIRELAQGGAQPNLNMGKIRDTIIPLPPLPEQTRIVQKLEELMQYCDGLEAGIKESMAQNERLLQQVLREALRG